MATKTFKVSLSLDNPRIIQSGINVRSFDKQSIKIVIELTKDSQVYQIPTDAQIKISLLKLARQEQKIILDVPFTSTDSIDWIVPEYLDGYQGAVRVGVYLIVGTENIDAGYFNMTSTVSDIDSAAEEFTESVLQGWAIEDLTALLPKFQAVLDETTGKDVISAPEIILARDGATSLRDRLDSDKAEVTAQLAETAKSIKNEWLKKFAGKTYIAHKGFHGVMEEESTSNGFEIPNSAGSFEAAGKLGYKIIELDIQVLADGTWVVYHDSHTGTMLEGANVPIDTITLDEFKNRIFYRKYTAESTYWIMSKELFRYNPITFEEALLIAKKYDMFIMPEVKISHSYVYTDADWDRYAETVKKTGMEEKLFAYGSSQAHVTKIMERLPRAIATMTMQPTVEDCKFITSFKNHFVLVGKTVFDQNRRDYIEQYNLPYAVWTIDSNEEANHYFSEGANFVLTNWLLNIPNLTSYKMILKYEDTVSSLKDVKGVGTYNYDPQYKITKFTTTDFNAKQLIIPASNLRRGDIIRIKASGRTLSQANSNFGRIYVSNKKTGFPKRELMEVFKNKAFETKELYYTVPDKPEDITISIGLEGQGITGNAEAEFRNITVEWYSNRSEIAQSNQRYSSLYSYSQGVYLKAGATNFGIKQAYQDPVEPKLLVIEYDPFTAFRGNPIVMITVNDYNDNEGGHKKYVVPVQENPENGKIRLKIYNDDWTQKENVGTNLRMGFNIQILN